MLVSVADAVTYGRLVFLVAKRLADCKRPKPSVVHDVDCLLIHVGPADPAVIEQHAWRQPHPPAILSRVYALGGIVGRVVGVGLRP